ncbi:MAG: gliding motility lipoprotein GldH [Schleiferiaceae bacterium]
MRKFFIGLLAAFTVVSCSQETYYQEYIDLNETHWTAENIIEFNVPVEDVSMPFFVGTEIRHNNEYPYANLYLFRTITSENGLEYSDTVNYTLASNDGAWLGSGVGEVKTMKFPYALQAMRLKDPGNYTFTFQQGMRDEELEGILSLGLTLIQNPTNE